MFLNSSLPSYAVAIIIVVVAAQYALALFCLLKLAYLDISKKEYVLWNLLILLVFFIGAAVFLVYYSKVKDAKRIPPYVEQSQDGAQPQSEDSNTAKSVDAENAEKDEADEKAENAEATEERKADDDGNADEADTAKD